MLVLLFFAWGLLVVPTMCLSGSLPHDCECGEMIDCTHETDCSQDPCNENPAILDAPANHSAALPEQVYVSPITLNPLEPALGLLDYSENTRTLLVPAQQPLLI